MQPVEYISRSLYCNKFLILIYSPSQFYVKNMLIRERILSFNLKIYIAKLYCKLPF